MSTLFAARYVSLTQKYNVCRQVRRYKHTFTNCFKYIFQKEFPFGMVHIPAHCEESSSRNSREHSRRQTVDSTEGNVYIMFSIDHIFPRKKKNCHNSRRFMDGFTSSCVTGGAFYYTRHNSNFHRRLSQRFIALY